MNAAQAQPYAWQHPDWPRWHFDAAALAGPLARAWRMQGIAQGKLAGIGMPPGIRVELIQEGWARDAVATAAIEGVRLSLGTVRSSVMRKLGFPVDGRTDSNIDGLIDVMHDAAVNAPQALDAVRLCRWQAALFPDGRSGLQRIQTGQFRTFSEPMQIVSGPIGHERVHYRAPDSTAVPAEMDAFLAWFGTAGLDPLLHAGLAHLWFETIHPFEDGNGRIGRAIVDMALARELGPDVWLYGLSRQLSAQRKSYYDALSRAQGPSMDATAWLQWFVAQFELACAASAASIDSALSKARFWAGHGQKPLKERQFKVVRRLLDAGDGGFLGGLTAEKYAKIAGVSKATATRDLAVLLREELLFARGAGRATRYFVRVPGWEHAEAEAGQA